MEMGISAMSRHMRIAHTATTPTRPVILPAHYARRLVLLLLEWSRPAIGNPSDGAHRRPISPLPELPFQLGRRLRFPLARLRPRHSLSVVLIGSSRQGPIS